MRFLRNIHIQTRLLCSFILLSLIPVLITGSLQYRKSSEAIHEKIETYSVELLNQISQNIDRELSRLVYDSIEIMFFDDVQKALSEYENLSEWEILILKEGLQDKLVKKFSFLHDVSDVILYTNSNEKILAYGDEGSKILNYHPALLSDITRQSMEAKGRPIWLSTNINDEIHRIDLLDQKDKTREGIVLAREIRNINQGNPIGTILIRTNEAYFSKIYDKMDTAKQKIVVINGDGQIISTNDEYWPVGESFYDQNLINEVRKSEESSVNSFEYNLGKDYLVFFDKVANADWYIISLTPYDYLQEETNRILGFTIIVGLMTMSFAIVLSYVIARSISHPLKNMIESMKKVKDGQLDIEIQDKSSDELAEVNSHFNMMLQEIRVLLKETKLKEHEKRVAELSALQAQINPHFLSNTLNSVKWLAHIQHADNIESLITSLIELLHLSMGNDNNFITISDEIIYLEHYMNIQAYRYYDKFSIEFDVDTSIQETLIPRFLIQPLVENALIHGIEPSDEKGTIVVKAWQDQDLIRFAITDNGVGIPPTKLQELINEKIMPQNRFNGIGVMNVRERLKLYYGEPYDISIESIEGVFTRIEIAFPITRKGDEDYV